VFDFGNDRAKNNAILTAILRDDRAPARSPPTNGRCGFVRELGAVAHVSEPQTHNLEPAGSNLQASSDRGADEFGALERADPLQVWRCLPPVLQVTLKGRRAGGISAS
jgi:hypothetical protein